MGRSRRARAALVVALLVGLGTVGGAGAPVGAAAGPGAGSAADLWLVVNPTFEPLDGAPLEVPGVGEFRGAIRLARSAAGGGIGVVNQLPLDDYLRGISEVPTSWPIEAQKAQAIAARTYALHEIGRGNRAAAHRQVGADLCATDACQVYAGLEKERRAGSEAWLAAVEQTKGQVVLYRGAPILAKYSSSNGGQTVPGGQPYLRATPDPDDAASPLHRWRSSFPIADVVRVAGLAAEPTTLTRRGDAVVATYLDPDGGAIEQTVPVADFRARLNGGFAAPAGLPLPVPSVRYDVVAVDGTVVVDGRGWGHGIGLSQYGALGKAWRGMKAPDILAAYYAGLRPVAVPPEKLPSTVRVAVALDRAEATVGKASGRFRIVDGTGRVVVPSASGHWSGVPAAGGAVRLVPPADQAGPPAAGLTAVEPAVPRPGDAVVARIELRGPAALTRITLTTPDGDTRELDAARLRLPGPLTVRLGPATTATAGDYRIDLEQDAGAAGRATTPILVGVTAPSTAAATVPGGAAPPGPDGEGVATTADHGEGGRVGASVLPAGALKGLATLLLVAVTAAGALWVGRRPGIPLH